MQRVTIHAMPKWALPVIDGDTGNTVDPINPDGLYTAQQQLTYRIGGWMLEITAEAMNKLTNDSGLFYPDGVFVRFEAMHAKNFNAPDLYIVVAPMWSEHYPTDAAILLRNEIVNAINLSLMQRPSVVENPSYDVVVDFMHGAGCSVNKMGWSTTVW